MHLRRAATAVAISLVCLISQSQREALQAAAKAETEVSETISAEKIQTLVARIALYPDDLVAVIVAASTYPLQIVQAARLLEDRQTKADVKPDSNWDGSVISLLNYPDILKMMNQDLEWTEQLGELAISRQRELLDAIQQLREQAIAKDILKSSDKVSVQTKNESIIIESPDPKVIYVPSYDPAVLTSDDYVASAPIEYDSYPWKEGITRGEAIRRLVEVGLKKRK
jgi:Protein of unknown function (DUF3300)